MIKERFNRIFKIIFTLVVLGIIYFIIVTKIGFGIPCKFYLITGLKCPSCGITHAVLHMVEGRIDLAVKDNLMIILFIPIIVFDLIFEGYRYVVDHNSSKWFRIFLIVQLMILLSWAVIRNILNI